MRSQAELPDLSTIGFSLCAVVVITLRLIAGNPMAMNVRERFYAENVGLE